MTSRLDRIVPTAALLLWLAGNGPARACDGWTLGAGIASLSASRADTRVDVHVAPAIAAVVGIPRDFELRDLGADPESARTLALAIGCEMTSHWAVQLEAGVPPTIAVHGRGVIAIPGPTSALLRLDLDDEIRHSLADQKVWSPILAARYRMGSSDARLRPFASIGLSYTWFTDERVQSGFDDAIDRRFGQPLALAVLRPGRTRTRVQIDPQWAPLAAAGVEWRLAPRWRLSASLGYSPLRVDARFRTRAADGTGLARARSRSDLDVLGSALVISYELNPRSD